MRYSKAELERWVALIDDHSRGRVERIEQRLGADPDLKAWIMSKPDHRERLFAALATGDPEYLRSRSRDWVSWVEDNPPHLWLSTSPTVGIDLDDRTDDLHKFRHKYGCTPEQFARLIRHRPHDRPGPVLINLRADDLSAYTDGDVGQLLGPILAEADHHPERFYRLQHVRPAAFRLLGLDWSGITDRARALGDGYRACHPALVAGGSVAGTEVTRSGDWPVPGQIDGRIAYYLAIRELVARHGGASLGDTILDGWLAGPGPADADAANQRPLRDRLARLYLHHHLLSAPLTGGLGGHYAMLAREVDHATRHLVEPSAFAADLGAAGKQGRVGLATWMFRQQAGMDPRAGRAPRGVGAPALVRYPDDHNFNQFLGRVDHNRVAITADRGDMLDEIDMVVERIARRRRRTSRPLDVEEEIMLFRDMIDIGARDGCKVPTAILNGIGVGGAIATVATGGGTATGVAVISLSIANLCAVFEKAQGLLRSHSWGEGLADRLDRVGERLCSRRFDRVRIDRFVGTLWL
jgi:hypothetical protein